MLRRLLPIIVFLSIAFPVFAQDATPEPTAEPTPVVVVTDVPPAPPIIVEQPSDVGQLLDKALNLILVLIIAFMAYKQGALTSPETLDKIFSFLRSVTKDIPGENDDKLLGIIEEVVRRVAAEDRTAKSPMKSDLEVATDYFERTYPEVIAKFDPTRPEPPPTPSVG